MFMIMGHFETVLAKLSQRNRPAVSLNEMIQIARNTDGNWLKWIPWDRDNGMSELLKYKCFGQML